MTGTAREGVRLRHGAWGLLLSFFLFVPLPLAPAMATLFKTSRRVAM